MTLSLESKLRLKGYRLAGNVPSGVQELDRMLFEEADHLRRNALFWDGVTQLKARSRAKDFYQSLNAPVHTRDHIAYAKFLVSIGDVDAAHRVMPKGANLGPMAKALGEKIRMDYAVLQKWNLKNLSEVPAKLFELARQQIPLIEGRNILFYSGQLGPGGAERQFSKVAIELQQNLDIGQKLFIAVRHTDPARQANFHVENLTRQGLKPFVLNAEPADQSLHLTPQIAELVQTLPDDVRDAVTKLATFIKSKNVGTIFAWQDGGILIGALAAALAGAARIVTSVRGLPPNLRPKLFREEYKPLYSAMIKDPLTEFTSNSQTAAQAYGEWLGTDKKFSVVRNAISKPDTSADETTKETWDAIQAASPTCTKTVLGVFRTDPVKQPELWFRAACDMIDANPDTRFIHVGLCVLCPEIEDTLSKHYPDRIFRVGISKHVGFWMHQADMLIHLAKQEGSPNVIVEAQLCDLPVIATPAGGTVEAIENKKTGILFDTTTPTIPQICDALSLLEADPSLANSIKRNAFQYAQKSHDPAIILTQIKHLLNHSDQALVA